MGSRRPSDRHSAKLPHELIWALATLSLLLPFAAMAAGGLGAWRLLHGETGGWAWVGAGIACLVLDFVIDLWLANPHNSQSEEPHLNCRGSQCIGRVGALTEAIEGGRGKIRLGDTIWTVECAQDLAAGAMVRVTGSNGTVLRVEGIDG